MGDFIDEEPSDCEGNHQELTLAIYPVPRNSAVVHQSLAWVWVPGHRGSPCPGIGPGKENGVVV